MYDTYDATEPAARGYRIKMARDFEDMAKVIAIRASACFSDPEHIYSKHFDGNDFSATHFIGFVDGEPVASVRVRYFADFTRLERLTVRPTHRNSRIAFAMVKAAFAFCRAKGYRRLSGVAREEMVPFWSLFGGDVTTSRDPIHIYGMAHYEMSITFPEDPAAITSSSPTMVLLRPEGRWNEAGYHETQKVTAVPAKPDRQAQSGAPVSVVERMAKRRRRQAARTGRVPIIASSGKSATGTPLSG